MDSIARLLAVPLAASLGQPVVVENRPGASGSIGAAEVARALPDGHTLLADSSGHVVNPAILRGLSFDYATSFAPLSRVVIVPQTVIVHPSLPVTTLREFVAYAKARPGQLSYGSPGIASGSHLCSLMLSRLAGLDMVHVPYRGGMIAVQDLLGNRITMMVSATPYTLPLARDGKIRVLAVATHERIPLLPDVPTFAEEGFAGAELSEWNALFAPAGTPKEILARLHAIVREAVTAPETRQRFQGMGFVPVGSDPETFTREVQEERETMGKFVRDAGIELG